jgi:hypothetical protein
VIQGQNAGNVGSAHNSGGAHRDRDRRDVEFPMKVVGAEPDALAVNVPEDGCEKLELTMLE